MNGPKTLPCGTPDEIDCCPRCLMLPNQYCDVALDLNSILVTTEHWCFSKCRVSESSEVHRTLRSGRSVTIGSRDEPELFVSGLTGFPRSCTVNMLKAACCFKSQTISTLSQLFRIKRSSKLSVRYSISAVSWAGVR